ncbi:hypothetical protein [Sneathiella chinensis]|uniref:Antifreeze glycopeptide n=1 Tax=Sneathiella chinensis TaxID=349750 RepID=A0ABQ5U302_9PROT|nr:hypothetical protein [Sneathiella chinensis]GLQ05628.1 hypothetical protein GCM10007924_08490 [Sneathiella chinensis]
MISSRNKTLVGGLALCLTASVLFVPGKGAATEKPRSLVPGFVQEQNDQTSPGQPAEAGSERSGGALDREVPRSREGLIVERLDAINPASVGLIGSDDGGLGASLWRGTEPRVIDLLYSGMPTSSVSAQTRDLQRRFLLTGALVPGSQEVGQSILETRLRKLRDAGLGADAVRMLDRLPLGSKTAATDALHADLALLAGENDKACALRDAASTDSFQVKLDIFCKLLAEDFDRAELGASLLAEQGEKDPLFFALVARLAGGEGAVKVAQDTLSGLDVAMIRAAGLSLDGAAFDRAPSGVVAALMKAPSVLTSGQGDLAFRLAREGLLPAADLRALLEGAGKADSKAAPSSVDAVYGALLKAVSDASSASAKAEQLETLFSLASANGDFSVISALVIDDVAGLEPDAYVANFELQALKALILHNRFEAASEWERHIRRSALQGNAAERLAARKTVAKLDAYLLLAGGQSLSRWNQSSLVGWLNAVADDPEQASKTEFLLLSLEALGYSISAEDWEEALPAALSAVSGTSNGVLERNLTAAAGNRRVGEVVGLSLALLGKDGAETLSSNSLAVVLSGLRAVGLEREAGRLAFEAALFRNL